MTDATRARLTAVARRVDTLIAPHKCREAASTAQQGGPVIADMAVKICACAMATRHKGQMTSARG